MKIKTMKDYVSFIVDGMSELFFTGATYTKSGVEPEALIATMCTKLEQLMKPSQELLKALNEIKDSNDIPDLRIDTRLTPYKTPDERPTWDAYFLRIAQAVSARSTCKRRQYGAVVVKDGRIVSTGYNGAPSGTLSCIEKGICERQAQNIPSRQRYELCESVHAEANALLSASREEAKGATLYIAGWDAEDDSVADGHPCAMCARLIRNSGVKTVVYTNKDNTLTVIPVQSGAVKEI